MLAVVLTACRSNSSATAEPIPASTLAAMSEADVLCSIAGEIEALKPSHPQLAEFQAAEHCDRDRLVIGYQYRCDPPAGGAGWRGATPSPRSGGVWLYLDFHDPSSKRQIHTQPAVPKRVFRDRDVMLLLVEGPGAPSIGLELEAILQRHGIEATGF